MLGRRVLLIYADRGSRDALRAVFEREGADVVDVTDGRVALKALYDTHPDLVLVDMELSGLSGLELLGRIRDVTDVPILVVTAVGDQAEKVRALRAGADDYITRPFDTPELCARSEALLRRLTPGRGPSSFGDALVQIDPSAADARAAGKPLELTPLEFRLLTAFVRNPDRVLSPEQLLTMVWRDSGPPRQRVKLTVAYLREKFRRQGLEAPIRTVHGFGYRYMPPSLDGLDSHLAKFEHLFAPLDEIRGPSGQRFFPSQAARDELAAALRPVLA